MEALRVEKLTRNFGALQAVSNVSLAVEPGERRAIIGPNGAGKTTLFNLISGELAPSAGQVFMDGENVTHWAEHQRSHRGMARTFQRNNLFSNLTVFENVRLAVQQCRGISRNLVRRSERFEPVNRRTTELLDQMGLADRTNTPAKNLSYGEQRQLEMAIALATEPSVLLLDEPTAGMSPAETKSITELLHALPRALTLLIIEHDMDVVFRLAERVTVLHYGQVLLDGKAEAVRNDPRVLEVYLGTTTK